MNNLQPFEKHLADQLQHVPVPNKEEGWIEMRKLLDEDLPEGGSAWSGNRKWWWMGITVAIIIAGMWTSQELREKESASANTVTVAKKQSTQPVANPSPTNHEKKSNDPLSVDDKQPSIEPQTHAVHVTKNDNIVTKINAETDKYNGAHQPAITDRKNVTDVSADPNKHNDALAINSSNRNGIVKNELHKRDKSRQRKTRLAVGTTTSSFYKPAEAEEKTFATVNVMSTDFASDNNTPQFKKEFSDRSLTANVASLSASSILLKDPMEEFSSVSFTYEPLKAEPGKTDKAFAKEMRKQSMKSDDRKMSAKEMRGYEREKDRDLTFAAGLALPQSFAISDQQTSSYGVNASASHVSDYLPVPFFQYHMSPRLFFQTELQFQSPQYTNRLLLYQGQQQVAQSMVEKNIFIEKLYYFHIPFNIYFSPASNFYVGSGIQFSSLLSGVATYQTNQYTGGTLQNSYSHVEGFKDDSLASKLSSSEWRYQLDANYYLKRFTFGARYNQAFSQFVNIQPSPTLPSTVGRNQSFFIYLRYNIWEERKK